MKTPLLLRRYFSRLHQIPTTAAFGLGPQAPWPYLGRGVSSATPTPQECQHLAFFYLQHCPLTKGKLPWHLLSRSSTRVLLLWETWQWIVWTNEEFSGAVSPLQQEEADILVTIPFWYKLFSPPVLGGLFTDDKKKIIFPCLKKKVFFCLFFFCGPSELKINQAGCF